MNSRAILVAASLENDPTPSVYEDLESFRAFLNSNPGGAWDKEKVFCEKNCTRDQILAAVQAAKNTDYTLIYFKGSGEMAKTELPWMEARLHLASGETVSERDLNSGSPRCTLILDCSRRICAGTTSAPLINVASLLDRCEGGTEFRMAYEDALLAAEGGLVKIYAPPMGGGLVHSFTQHLLKSANSWFDKNQGILNLKEAVDLATSSMQKEDNQQKPEYRGGRRLHDFPFAVRI